MTARLAPRRRLPPARPRPEPAVAPGRRHAAPRDRRRAAARVPHAPRRHAAGRRGRLIDRGAAGRRRRLRRRCGAAAPATRRPRPHLPRHRGRHRPADAPRPGRLLWAPRAGSPAGGPPAAAGVRVVGGFLGPGRRTDPADLDFADIADLVAAWPPAACRGDLATLAALATESARRNARRRGPDLAPILAAADATARSGIVAAHTGSALGLLFAPGRSPADAAIADPPRARPRPGRALPRRRKPMTARDHGGDLGAAIRRYGGAEADWIDLSTGINRCPWPAPPLAPRLLHALPRAEDVAAAAAAARAAYGAGGSRRLPAARRRPGRDPAPPAPRRRPAGPPSSPRPTTSTPPPSAPPAGRWTRSPTSPPSPASTRRWWSTRTTPTAAATRPRRCLALAARSRPARRRRELRRRPARISRSAPASAARA